MVYRYRVTLSGIKGFFRVYHVNADTSLYTFHRQMRSDMEFPQDQLILFKALDEKGDVVARYGIFDLGSGTVDQITLADTLEKGVASFVYFYDVTNKKSVNITFEGEVEGVKIPVEFPRIAETKGPDPIEFENGYVAYEDLPDDQKHIHVPHSSPAAGDDDEDLDIDLEDDEDEEEVDDDEDGKEIYDENEGA